MVYISQARFAGRRARHLLINAGATMQAGEETGGLAMLERIVAGLIVAVVTASAVERMMAERPHQTRR